MSNLPAIHPGEILRDQYAGPLGLSAETLAAALNVELGRIEDLLDESASVSVDLALRLARYLGTTPELWLNMQSGFDLKSLRPALEAELTRIKPRDERAA